MSFQPGSVSRDFASRVQEQINANGEPGSGIMDLLPFITELIQILAPLFEMCGATAGAAMDQVHAKTPAGNRMVRRARREAIQKWGRREYREVGGRAMIDVAISVAAEPGVNVDAVYDDVMAG